MASENSYALLDFSLYPVGVLRTPFDGPREVTQLHFMEGIAEVVDRQNLSSAELRISLLAAAGLTNPQIGGLLNTIHGTPESFARNTFEGAFEKLDAHDRNQVVDRLFERRILRVIKPTSLPEFTSTELTVLGQNASGMTFNQIGDAHSHTARWAQMRGTDILRKLGVATMTQAVLLGRLGGALPYGTSPPSGPFQTATEAYQLWPPAVMDNPEGAQIDFVRWGRAVFTMRDQGQLSPAEQRVLAFTALGYEQPEIARITGKTTPSVQNHSIAACRKLGAKNKTHALTQALDREDIRITRYIRYTHLEKLQLKALIAAAKGLTSEQSEPFVGRSAGMIRDINSETISELGARTISGAVMKAYLSRILEVDEVLETVAV